MTKEKASKIADKESEEELGKRVESQKSKEGLPNLELWKEADKVQEEQEIQIHEK